MYSKLVKDFMIPVSDYPAIHKNASVQEAVILLKGSQANVPIGAQPFRAVLVRDDNKKIVGKVGYLTFLRALEPKYDSIFDMKVLSRAAYNPNFITSMMGQFNLWDNALLDICKIAKSVKVSEVMQPVEDHIDESSSLPEAIHKIIMWQSLSILVVKGKEITGILRLSDIYNEIEDYIINECNKNEGA